ncbi:MAG: lysoplasmalogenase [Candidatus Dormibacteraeota bacterium]|nr:lysoplasmalogenase [Candidatus Dormibacteraeota bacterium]
MTQIAWLVLATAIASAVVDWIAVVREHLRLRWIFKPGTILLLALVTLALQPTSNPQRYLFVAALLLSLLGDVFLLMSDRHFRAGLIAFLTAHLAYCLGFLVAGANRGLLTIAVPAVAVVSLAIGGRILRALADHPPPGVWRAGRGGAAYPVTAYLLAISAMLTLAAASGKSAALIGAMLFYVSDGLIAWNRFVRPLAWSQLPVIVTYHLGQVGLVLSLAT